MEAEEMIISLTEHETRIKRNEKRIEDLENKADKISTLSLSVNNLEKKTDKLESLTLSVQSLATSVKQMAEDQSLYRSEQNELAKRILNVEQKPARDKAEKFDHIAKTVTTVVLSALVGFVLAYLGIK